MKNGDHCRSPFLFPGRVSFLLSSAQDPLSSQREKRPLTILALIKAHLVPPASLRHPENCLRHPENWLRLPKRSVPGPALTQTRKLRQACSVPSERSSLAVRGHASRGKALGYRHDALRRPAKARHPEKPPRTAARSSPGCCGHRGGIASRRAHRAASARKRRRASSAVTLRCEIAAGERTPITLGGNRPRAWRSVTSRRPRREKGLHSATDRNP